MPESPLRLIKRCAEYLELDAVRDVPADVRGIYVLYNYRRRIRRYDVVYVGMARNSVRRRLTKHASKKAGLWSHFSVYEVWDNIRDEEIAELEGLFRHLYKSDSAANKLNVQRGFRKMREIRDDQIAEW